MQINTCIAGVSVCGEGQIWIEAEYLDFKHVHTIEVNGYASQFLAKKHVGVGLQHRCWPAH
jgi:hypothetical protein